VNRTLLLILILSSILHLSFILVSQPFMERNFDAESWLVCGGAVAEGNNVYITGEARCNYPPLWYYLIAPWIFLLGKTYATMIPIKIMLTAFNLLMSVVLYHLAAYKLSERAALTIAGVYAFHPISVYIAAIHGQIDGIAIFFVMLTIYLLVRYSRENDQRLLDLAALSIGLGAALKIFPIFLLPFLLFRKEVTKKIRFFLLAGVPGALVFLPYIFSIESLIAIKTYVLGYGGGFAGWGFALLLRVFLPENILIVISAWLKPLATPIALAAVVVVGWLARKQELLVGATAVFVALFIFLQNWAAQYVIWLLPFAVMAPHWPSIAHQVSSTLAAAFWAGSNIVKVITVLGLTTSFLLGLSSIFRIVTWVTVIIWGCYLISPRLRRFLEKAL